MKTNYMLYIAIIVLLFLHTVWGYASLITSSLTHRSSRLGDATLLQCNLRTTGSISKYCISFHRAERVDMKGIAEILSAAFDKKPNALVRWYSVWNYEEQLKERLVRLVEMGKKSFNDGGWNRSTRRYGDTVHGRLYRARSSPFP